MGLDDELFADLAAQAEAWQQRERDAEIADLTRTSWGSVRWADRCAGARVGLRVDGIGTLHGVVDTVAASWLLLRVDDGAQWVVALDAVTGVDGAAPSSTGTVGRGEVVARTGWIGAWTVLVRDRETVQVVRRDGTRVDGAPVRAGEDFVEIRTDGGRAELVPYVAVAAIRTARIARSRGA